MTRAKLKCNPGNYQCGGRCQSNKLKCKITVSEAEDFDRFFELVQDRIQFELGNVRSEKSGAVTERTAAQWTIESEGGQQLLDRLDQHIAWWQNAKGIEPKQFEADASATNRQAEMQKDLDVKKPILQKARNTAAKPIPETPAKQDFEGEYAIPSKADAKQSLDKAASGNNSDAFFDKDAGVYVKYGGEQSWKQITPAEIANTRRANELGLAPAIVGEGDNSLAVQKANGAQVSRVLGKLATGTDDQQKLYARGLMQSMEKLHRSGLVHGDLHDDNIFVDGQGNVQFIDFGESNKGHNFARDLMYIRNFQGNGEHAQTKMPILASPKIDKMLSSMEDVAYGFKSKSKEERQKVMDDFYAKIYDEIDAFSS